ITVPLAAAASSAPLETLSPEESRRRVHKGAAGRAARRGWAKQRHALVRARREDAERAEDLPATPNRKVGIRSGDEGLEDGGGAEPERRARDVEHGRRGAAPRPKGSTVREPEVLRHVDRALGPARDEDAAVAT